MGAKISKRGSYNLSKREKKKKKSKAGNLQERAPSFISLTLQQIYEDSIKSPDLSKDHKFLDNTHEDISEKDIQIVLDVTQLSKPSSDHGICSTSSDEELYQNVFGEDAFDPEAQVERRMSNSTEIINKAVIENNYKEKRRRTWSKPSESSKYDDDYYDITEISSKHSEQNEEYDERIVNRKTNSWKEVLNGEFWTENVPPSEIEQSTHNQKDDTQVEVSLIESAYEHEIKTLKKESNTDLNGSVQDIQEDQVETFDDIKIANQVENTESLSNEQKLHTHYNEHNESNEDKKQDLYAQLHNKESHVIPADSIEKLRDMLQEQTTNREEPLHKIAEDEEDLSEQLEIQDVKKEKQAQKVKFEDEQTVETDAEVDQNNSDLSITAEQVEIQTVETHKTLSKSSSVNSEVFYEVSDTGFENESEYEEQEAFYDAEEGEFYQVEVVNEVQKDDKQTNVTNEVVPLQNLEANFVDKQNNFEAITKKALDLYANDDNVGILIDSDEDTPVTRLSEFSEPLTHAEEQHEAHRPSLSEQVEVTNDNVDDLIQLRETQNAIKLNHMELTTAKVLNPEEELIMFNDNKTEQLIAKVDNLIQFNDSSQNNDSLRKSKPSIIEVQEDQQPVNDLASTKDVADPIDDFLTTTKTDLVKVGYKEDLRNSQIRDHDVEENTIQTIVEVHTDTLNSANGELAPTKPGEIDASKQSNASKSSGEVEINIINHPEKEVCRNNENNNNPIIALSILSDDKLSTQNHYDKKLSTAVNSFMDPLTEQFGDENSVELSVPLEDSNEEFTERGAVTDLNTQNMDNHLKAEPQKPDQLILTSKSNIKADLLKDEFKVTSPITTPEEVAEEQMRLWERQQEEEIEAVLSEINKIMGTLDDLKNKIKNLGSTKEDKEMHTEMYQTLIKIMREVNGVNNFNFNQRILDLQHEALNEVHGCIKDLQIKNTN